MFMLTDNGIQVRTKPVKDFSVEAVIDDPVEALGMKANLAVIQALQI